MKKYYITIFIVLVLLFILVYDLCEVDYICKKSNNIISSKGNFLLLNDKEKSTFLPHLNIKGKVTEINDDVTLIQLSDNSKEFLQTEEIYLENCSNLNVNDDVFVKFNEIKLSDTFLFFENLEVYKLIDDIPKENIKKMRIFAKMIMVVL